MTYRDQKHSGRRAFLRGAGGVIIGLPLLELTHGHVFADGDAPKRFITVFSHGGTISNQSKSRGSAQRYDGSNSYHGEDWFRPGPGEALSLGPIMGDLGAVAQVSSMLSGSVTEGGDGLEPFRDKMVVLTAINNMAGIRQGEYGGGHGFCNKSALTCQLSGDASAGPSIDHVLSERLLPMQPTRFGRLHFKAQGHDYGTPFFSGAGAPLSGETSPGAAWSTIFDGVTSEGPDPELLRRQQRQQSILDGVREGMSVLRSSSSQSDRLAIDEHLEHLRALEREIQSLEVSAACTVPTDPGSVGERDAEQVAPLFADMIVAALRCGLTNVACLEISDIICDWTGHGNIMQAPHHIGHGLHHMARDVGPTGPMSSRLRDWLTEMLENRRWRMGLVRRILAGLEATPEGEGTMLDNCLLLYTSEFSNGTDHLAYNQPCFLAGSAGGAIATGRHLNFNPNDTSAAYSSDYTTTESTHNLYTSILHAFGGTDEHFGNMECDHTGPLPGLL